MSMRKISPLRQSMIDDMTARQMGPKTQKDYIRSCKLFTRFRRGQTKASGKGLGLYLVRTLVESYRGCVRVEDRVPGDHTKGAKFVVMLPAIEKQLIL